MERSFKEEQTQHEELRRNLRSRAAMLERIIAGDSFVRINRGDKGVLIDLLQWMREESADSQQPTWDVLDAPNAAGFWWYLPKGKSEWEMVDARELGPNHICLYSCSKQWGGHTLEMARESLPGKWVAVLQPALRPGI